MSELWTTLPHSQRTMIRYLTSQTLAVFRRGAGTGPVSPEIAVTTLLNVLGWTVANRFTKADQAKWLTQCLASLPMYVTAYEQKELKIKEEE